MGFLSSLIGMAAPLIGGALGGPGGSLLGGLVSSGMSAVGSSMAESSAQSEARRGAEIRNAQAVEQSQKQMDFQTASNAKQMAFQSDSVDKQMGFQTQSAQTAMDFVERLSGSSHQREMADLKAAGLNPILAAKYGGASTPAGVSPSGASASGATSGGAQAHIEDTIGPSLASGVAAKRLHTEMSVANQDLINKRSDNALRQQQIKTEKENTIKVSSEEDLIRHQEQLIRNQIHQSQIASAKMAQETLTEQHHTEGTRLHNQLQGYNIPRARTGAEISSSTYGKVVDYLMRLNPFGSTAVQLNSLRGK